MTITWVTHAMILVCPLSSKQRKPGWCDRILWLVHEDTFEGIPLSVQPINYSSVPEYQDSDHKPVIGEYIIQVNALCKIVVARYHACFYPQVLHRAPELPIFFEPLDTWCVTRSNTCSYTVVTEELSVSPWDWVGLYKVMTSLSAMFPVIWLHFCLSSMILNTQRIMWRTFGPLWKGRMSMTALLCMKSSLKITCWRTWILGYTRSATSAPPRIASWDTRTASGWVPLRLCLHIFEFFFQNIVVPFTYSSPWLRVYPLGRIQMTAVMNFMTNMNPFKMPRSIYSVWWLFCSVESFILINLCSPLNHSKPRPTRSSHIHVHCIFIPSSFLVAKPCQ